MAVGSILDTPKSGLEALVQTIACDDVIGWRNTSKHMIVFSTDSSFHVAGDGKLVGVPVPNDGRCRTNQNGIYHGDTIMDYPSVSQLGHLVNDHNKFILFAIVCNPKNSTVCTEYQELVKQVPNSRFASLSQNPEKTW